MVPSRDKSMEYKKQGRKYKRHVKTKPLKVAEPLALPFFHSTGSKYILWCDVYHKLDQRTLKPVLWFQWFIWTFCLRFQDDSLIFNITREQKAALFLCSGIPCGIITIIIIPTTTTTIKKKYLVFVPSSWHTAPWRVECLLYASEMTGVWEPAEIFRIGVVARKTKPWLEAWNFQPQSPTSRQARGLKSEFNHQWLVISSIVPT